MRNLLCTNGSAIAAEERYATRDDFCHLFNEEMSHLYRLCLLLTGDDVQAQRCFVAGLELSVNGNPVFKQWARSWARRMIVENAIRMIAPRPNRAGGAALAVPLELTREGETGPDKGETLGYLFELGDFERFVFVMSVLERYSDQDCSVLLGYPLSEIRGARTRALERIGQSCALNAAADATLVAG